MSILYKTPEPDTELLSVFIILFYTDILLCGLHCMITIMMPWGTPKSYVQLRKHLRQLCTSSAIIWTCAW